MLGVMNAIAQVSAAPVTGPKLDNRRVLAAIVDLLIVAAGAVVVLVAGDALTGDRQGALGAVILGWALYYFFALESGDGQTVGKKLMKLRVVRADGRPAGMREIAVRTILRVVDNYLVGLIVMLATGDRRQRIGDLAAGTMVADASAPAVAPAVAVAEPAAVTAEEPAADAPEADEPAADPADAAVGTQTITLPARPAPPETLSDLTEPDAEADAPAVPDPFRPLKEPAEEPVLEEPVEEAVLEEPVQEAVLEEPVQEEPLQEEPVAEEPVQEAVLEEPVQEEPLQEEPVLEAPVREEPVVDEPAVEEPVDEAEPVVQDEPVPVDEVQEDLPPVTSPSLEELAQDVAAAHVEPEAVEPEADEPEAEQVDELPEDDEPVTVKSVETVSAIDLVMGGVSEEESPEDTSESAQDAEDSASS
jgi:uncharacterized RDD family membrane protein YckC